MNKKQRKFTIAAIIIVLSIGYMMYVSIRDTSRDFITVDRLIIEKNTYYDKKLKIVGVVSDGTIDSDTMNLKLKFDLEDENKPGSKIKINYEGVIPDMFKTKSKVVVEGKYSKDNVFHATKLLTSCPSKYEAEENEKYTKGAKL